jgi:hypothetical protein
MQTERKNRHIPVCTLLIGRGESCTPHRGISSMRIILWGCRQEDGADMQTERKKEAERRLHPSKRVRTALSDGRVLSLH